MPLPQPPSSVPWDAEKQWAFVHLPREWRKLPNVGFSADDVTSPWTITYNCIAFAAQDETQPWWPTPEWIMRLPGMRYYYWPPGLPREDHPTVGNFTRAFETLGYRPCKNGKRKKGYEKVAIYVDDQGVPTHMARELGDGIWHSKLGDYQDIRHHQLEGAESDSYGKAKYFMQRRLPRRNLVVRFRQRIKKLIGK